LPIAANSGDPGAQVIVIRKSLFIFSVVLLAAAASLPVLQAQSAAPSGASAAENGSSKIPDLSGIWLRKMGIESISNSDIGGNKRGKEDDIPYQPWALTKTLSEKPPTGTDNQFDQTTDPWILYCEPPGLVRIYMEPDGRSSCRLPMLSTSPTRSCRRFASCV
jgi:hypothetical protein